MPNQLLYQIRRALFEPVSGFRSYCKGPGLQSAFRKLRVHDATLFADGLRSFDAPPAKDVTPAPKDIPPGGKNFARGATSFAAPLRKDAALRAKDAAPAP